MNDERFPYCGTGRQNSLTKVFSVCEKFLYSNMYKVKNLLLEKVLDSIFKQTFSCFFIFLLFYICSLVIPVIITREVANYSFKTR